jgi:hypothetical protein
MTSLTHDGGSGWRSWYLVFVAGVVTLVVLIGLKEQAVGFDLVTVYVPAAERVVDGASPFPEEDDLVWKGHQAYVYPPLTAFAVLPFTLLSSPTQEYVGVLAAIAILLLALWLAGVRDPRCYAVFLLWQPTMTAWQNANVSVLLALGCALAWRFRDSWPREGVALGLGIALKLVLWPLAIWLLATRRVRAVVAAAAVALVTTLATWAAIGFKGLTSYPDLLRMLTDVEGENSHSISIYSGVLALGGPSPFAYALTMLAGLALTIAVVAYARRGDDRAAFLTAILAVLAFAPVAWLHYLTMLAVPLAVYRPRLSGLWLVPLLFWVVAIPGLPVEPRRLVAAVVVGVIAGRLLIRPSSTSTASRRSRPAGKAVPEVVS